MILSISLLIAASYLLGSIPFGLWIALSLKGVDVREVGSKNIGATNVWRVCGPAIGSAVFTLDLLKGLLPPLVARYALHLDRPDSRWIVLSALAAILGHNYSLFLGFSGGKGIATSGGALLGAAPLVGAAAGGVFIAGLLVSSMISVGSIAAAASLPLLMWWLCRNDCYLFAFACAASLMAIYKHRANIARLRTGTERRVNLFGPRSAKPAEPPPAETKEAPPDAGP